MIIIYLGQRRSDSGARVGLPGRLPSRLPDEHDNKQTNRNNLEMNHKNKRKR